MALFRRRRPVVPDLQPLQAPRDSNLVRVVGVSFRQQNLYALGEGSRDDFVAQPDPSNQASKHAVAIGAKTLQVGFLPDGLAREYFDVLQALRAQYLVLRTHGYLEEWTDENGVDNLNARVALPPAEWLNAELIRARLTPHG